MRPLAEVAEGDTWRLDEAARGRLTLGPELALLFQFVPAPPQPLRSGRQDFRPRYIEAEDPVFYGFLGMFSALAAVAMVYVYTQPPGQNIDIERVEDVITRLVITPTPAPEPIEPILTPEAPAEVLDRAAEPEGPSEVADTRAPADNPRTAAARERHVQQNRVLKAFLIATSGINQNGDKTSSLFGDDSQTAEDLDGVLLGVSGVQGARFDGPIVRGRLSSGDDATLGELDEASVNRVRVEPQEARLEPQKPLDLDPELKPTQVTQVADLVRRNAPQLQRCYELALNDQPSLEGRVEIAWTIMDGRSEMVEVYRNTTGSQALASCMVERVERWKYPEGLETDLIYPFVLTRQN